METWHNRLDYAMKMRGKKWPELVKATGLSKPSVYAWRPDAKKRTEMMNGDNAAVVCAWLEINSRWLFEGIEPSGLSSQEEESYEYVKPNSDSSWSAKTSVSSQKLPFDDGYKPAGTLVDELQSRDIPPHIEQAIMALLQTCEKSKKATQPAPHFTVAEQRKHMENLRNKLSPDVRQQFDGWLEFVRTDGKHGLPSTSNFVAGADPLPTSGGLPAGKTASS